MNPLPTHIEFGFLPEAKGTTPKLTNQVHGRNVVSIPDAGARETLVASPPDGDGQITSAAGVELHVYSADCVPVLLFTTDPSGPVAAVHSGWRGTLAGVVPEALSRFDPKDEIWAWVGPAIGLCCFEVRLDFVKAFEEGGQSVENFLSSRGTRLYCDLTAYIRETQLQSLPDSRVLMSDHRCTVCSAPPLPSYRRNGNTDTQIRSWIRKRG